MRFTPRNHWREADGRYTVNSFAGPIEVDAFQYYEFKVFMFAVFIGLPLLFVVACLGVIWERFS